MKIALLQVILTLNFKFQILILPLNNHWLDP